MMINMVQNITALALINALDISKKKISEVKIVVNGAGAQQSLVQTYLKNKLKNDNVIMCDRKGVIYKEEIK